MKRSLASVAILLLFAVIINTVMPLWMFAQRPERRTDRDNEGTPLLASGTRVIPTGYVIKLEMETRLDSKNSKKSDRFQAKIASPVLDAEGQTLLSQASYVEGHVRGAVPAKWARRSGVIAVDFDRIILPNGESLPIRAYLTSPDSEDRQRIDEEGNIKGGSPLKRDIVFIGGGAAGGAAIGMIAGGALAGAGIGAAVGLSATLLMKGKEAVIEPGQKIALALTEELRVDRVPEYLETRRREDERDNYERRNLPPSTPESLRPGKPGSNSGRTSEAPISGGAVNLSSISSERGSDGLIRILITAETPSTNWRIYTNHEIRPDMVEIRLRGVAPVASSASQISHPSAPAIIIPDRNNRIRKITIIAKNTTETIGVNGTWTNRNPGSSRPRPTESAERPGSGGRPNTGADSSGSLTPVALASQIEKEIELIRFNFASSIGIWLDRDGKIEALSDRRPTRDEERFFESLSSLFYSIRTWQNDSSTIVEQRNNLLKVREDYQTVESLWRRIPMSAESNRQVREMLGHVELLTRQ